MHTKNAADRPILSRTWAGLAAAALAMLVAGCIFAPGKFTSQLDIRKDRSFTFRYTGEILMLPLMKQKETEFSPESCYTDGGDMRECTRDELADQKKTWQEQRDSKRKSDAQAAQMMLGGMDPNDPKAGPEFAAKLSRQAGWNKVVYLGDGKFDVDFAMSGRLDRDFQFPSMEGFSMSNAFVQVSVRKDGSLRIDAPAFGPSGSAGGAMAGMMSGMVPSEGADNGPMAMADGTFTVLTDGQILANNTEEGPAEAPGGRALTWKVSPLAKAAPTALVKITP